MGSAKTALLLTTAYNFEERKIRYLCMKPAIDTREGKSVIRSRIGIERECSLIYPETDLYLFLRKHFKEIGTVIDWILVDEAQFLSARQIDQLSMVVDDFGSNIICYGLRTDFKTNLFEGSKRLFEIADTIDEIKSTCTCGHKTIVNARIDQDGDIITEGEQVEIGGDERYMAVCRKCWRNRRIAQAERLALPFLDDPEATADPDDE
jgi:thymidine kinase